MSVIFKFGACTVLAIFATSVSADDPVQVSAKYSQQSQIMELVGMEPADRRAALKAMNPKERKGLWFNVHKAIAEQRAVDRTGIQPKGGVTVPPSAFNPSIQAVGTIAYDSGFASVGFGDNDAAPSNRLRGNQFDTHTGIPVLASGTVSTVVAQVVPGPANTTNSAGFVLNGAQTVGGNFLALFSTFNPVTGVIDTVTFSGMSANYTGSSYYVLFGDFSVSYIPVFGTGTTLGQGHHAVAGTTGGMGPTMTTINPMTGLNAFVRSSGNIVPVELMQFDVE